MRFPVRLTTTSTTKLFPFSSFTARSLHSSRINMTASDAETIQHFNEYVNMSAKELKEWLGTETSESSGWHGDGSGETTGHQSGRKIVDILERNPKKQDSKYSDEDLSHMRKVVAYCKRHLAQEDKLKDTKTADELEDMKSTKSLKNWGHDPLKTL